jgi:hypothetical protein
MDDRTGLNEPGATAEQDPDARAREIRAEIERTREDMSETVEAIQERLRPANLAATAVSGATERVKDLAATTTEKVKDMASTTTETAKDMAQSATATTQEWWNEHSDSGLIGKIRNHPFPAVLAGVGLTWLAFSNGGSRRRSSYDRRLPQAQSGDWRTTSGRAPEYGESMYDSGPRRAVAEARQTLRSGRSQLESMMREYPLAVGAAALIIGASLGMVVPETDRENELMGEARDNALERAQEAASGAVDRVKDAAAEVVTRATIGD